MSKKGSLGSARAYLQDDNFDIFVSILQLRPHDDWHLWSDAEENQLILKDKPVISLSKSSDTTDDIFRKAHPSLIYDHSYWTIILLNSSSSIFSFLGNDGVLRSCYFENKEWKCNISPLSLGFDIIMYVCRVYLENEFQAIQLPGNLHIDFSVTQAYIAGLRSENEAMKEILDCHQIIKK